MAELGKTVELLARFCLDIVVGIIFMVLIGVAALLIGLFVKWLDSFGIVPELLIQCLTYLEYALFVVDAVCFVFLVIMSAYKLVVEIIREYS